MFVCISYEREKGEREELERLRKTERQTSCHSRKEEWCRRVYWEIKKKKKKKTRPNYDSQEPPRVLVRQVPSWHSAFKN